MSEFVATLDEIPPGTSRVVNIGDHSIALFNVGGTIYALEDACPHAGASLGAGKIDGKTVTCRAHGLKFDITNGYAGGVPGFGAAVYDVQVVDGAIFLTPPG